MSAAPLRAVIDASVTEKIFVPEILSDQVQAVFTRFANEEGVEMLVPVLLFIACANVFWKWVQHQRVREMERPSVSRPSSGPPPTRCATTDRLFH